MNQQVSKPLTPGKVTIVGCGLIGGSIAFALTKQGWDVSVVDQDSAVEQQALAVGAATQIGVDSEADLVVVATPVRRVAKTVAKIAAETSAVITDVGSTKAQICSEVESTRFVGGHPMAGSELDGLAGAKADMFEGAMWILTPSEETDESAFTFVRRIVRSLGATAVVLDPQTHDTLVAEVSHVPHLTAATLMNQAATSSLDHSLLLRLAAGGFRDMTRISAGRAGIWPDICFANKAAITTSLDALVTSLSEVRQLVEREDHEGLLQHLETARLARLNLPHGFGSYDEVSEVTVTIANESGHVAKVSALAADLEINILDLDINHAVKGTEGSLRLLIDSQSALRLAKALEAQGYLVKTNHLEEER